MKYLPFILLLCLGCQKRELPAVDTTGLEPVIVAQITAAVSQVSTNRDSGPSWGKLGMILHTYEFHSSARICYEHAAALERNNPRWSRLRDAVDQGVVPPEVSDVQVGLKGWSDKAQQLLSNGKHPEAAPLIDHLMKSYPKAPEPWLLLGRLRLEQSDCAGAETALRRLLQISPDSVNAHFQLGIALICLDRYAEALPLLQRALELKPDFGEAHFNLGFALARSGNGRAAIPWFRNAIRYNPDMIDPYITLADLLSQTGELREATNLLARALQLNPADERAQNLLHRIQP